MASKNNQKFPSFSQKPSSSSSSYIPLHKTQLPPQMHNHFSLSSSPSSKSHHHKHLLLIISLSLLPFLLYILSLYNSLHLPPSSSFGLVIDISSSKSQIFVFRSLNEVSGTPFSGESSDIFWVNAGFFNFSGNHELVKRVVFKLIDFAKKKVPDFEWKDTKVQVFINAELAGKVTESERVLDECCLVLRSSGFLFRDDWASVLNGQDEGFYSWLAVNYAFGYLGNIPEETAGVVSLGRSAMQVTFASLETPLSESSRVIRLAGVPYSLYTQGLQQFGQDAVWKLLHKQSSQDLLSSSLNKERSLPNPCYPRGYKLTSQQSGVKLVNFYATGNFSACKTQLTLLLNDRKGNCTHAPCEMASSLFSELESKPHPQQKFFLSSQLRGLVPKASVSELEVVARRFCEDEWDSLKKDYDIDDTDLSKSCFSHAYMVILLRNSFGIRFDEKRVEFAAGSTPVDWRFGAFISRTIIEPFDEIMEHHDTHIVENESVTFFFLFAVFIIFVLVATFFVMKLRKPQMKTIYDLEKGCYIVTRVRR
ncbi:probable apyrase 6 isoform X1 [Amaranthus tricolor]|uniref:probable apyrase 6 isoform X1 n=1 Tax=Amaranthus tricolor TaxID=29722 RepID=UPI00258B872C|nr:probable apyrase 6 isoform X1 [Amaranthus tricolor]